MGKRWIAAFVCENGFAPPGWCHVEREDSVDDDLRKLPSDDEAAQLVVERAGMVGTAVLYCRSTRVFVRLHRLPEVDEGQASTDVDDGLMDEMLTLSSEASAPTWISMVPAVAARRAGLITKKAERAALRAWT
jgi:hypothetical protein